MRNRILIGITLILVSLSASVAPAAWGLPRSRLATLAAKQGLCDEVCVARSKGYLTLGDRAEILADARKVLSAEEYPAFKRALDQIAPSTAVTPKYAPQVRQSPPTPARTPSYYANKPAERPMPGAGRSATPVQAAPQKPPVLIGPQQAAPLPPKHSLPSDGPVIPTTALEPEQHVAGS